MASTSTEPFGVEVNMILEPVKTSEDHVRFTSIAYFPDGQRMISGSEDKTTRRWDLQVGQEIEEARYVCEEEIWAAAVSRDGQWVVTGGGDDDCAELKACEVETGIMKTFEGHSNLITCIDISADSMLLASGSWDKTARIWNLDTGKLVAGPFENADSVGAVRFSTDSKKLAVKSDISGRYLEVWDVQSQKLDVSVGGFHYLYGSDTPIFWTNKNKNILSVFSFTKDEPKTIYEFDASTLETVGAPFEGHTKLVSGLALLFDGALLASSSFLEDTIKLWAFQSRQLLASFDVYDVYSLMPSPDSLQLAFTIYGNPEFCICNATSALLAIREIQSALPKSDTTLQQLLSSDATRRPPVMRRTPARRPVIFSPPRHQMPSPTIEHQQHIFLRHVRKLFHFASRTKKVPVVQHAQPHDPWNFPATSALPPYLSSSVQATRSGSRHEPPVVEVAAGRKVARLLAAKLPEYRKFNDTRHPSRQQTADPQDDPSSDVDSLPDVHWFKALLCYSSCWSHGRLRMPPRWRLERTDIPLQDGTTNTSKSGGGAHGGS